MKPTTCPFIVASSAPPLFAIRLRILHTADDAQWARTFKVLRENRAACDGITTLAARSEDGMRKGVLVCDFRSGADAILLDARGLEPNCDVRAWVHDNGRDFERYPVRMFGNRILLKKADSGCAAFFIESGLLWL